jgi:hypothetical protein
LFPSEPIQIPLLLLSKKSPPVGRPASRDSSFCGSYFLAKNLGWPPGNNFTLRFPKRKERGPPAADYSPTQFPFMEQSNTFDALSFEKKTCVLHIWFPDTMKDLLTSIDRYVKHWLTKTAFLKHNWVCEDITAEKWIELLQALNDHIDALRPFMENDPLQLTQPFSVGYFKTFFLTRLREYLKTECKDKLFKAIAIPFYFPHEVQ